MGRKNRPFLDVNEWPTTWGEKIAPRPPTKPWKNHYFLKIEVIMSFDIDCYETMLMLYGDDEGPRQFRIRQDSEKPFNLNTQQGRLLALKFLYANLPWDLFRGIFKLMIGMSTEVVHPISKQLVSRPQMKLFRVVFWRMFVYGPEFDQVMFWGKRFPEEIRQHFCRSCGNPQLALVWNSTQAICRQKNVCRHPAGNYVCHRAISMMGGFCFACIQHHNVVRAF